VSETDHIIGCKPLTAATGWNWQRFWMSFSGLQTRYCTRSTEMYRTIQLTNKTRKAFNL